MLSWRIVAASVTGTSHLAAGTPCQDAHRAFVSDAGDLLMALADGAGSAARSGEGATCAVETAITSMERILGETRPADAAAWRTAMTQVFADAHESIVTLAAQDISPLRLFATTLLCAIVTSNQLVIAQVGDGLAVARDSDDNLFMAIRPQRGEYANEANFITLSQLDSVIDVQVYDLVAPALALSTDGLLRLALKLPGYEPHAPFFKPLFDFAVGADDPATAQEQLAVFLNSPRVCARTDDDKTLALAVRM